MLDEHRSHPQEISVSDLHEPHPGHEFATVPGRRALHHRTVRAIGAVLRAGTKPGTQFPAIHGQVARRVAVLSGRMSPSLHTCHSSLTWVQRIQDIMNDPLDSWAVILPLPLYTTILRGWGLLQGLVEAAEFHLGLASPVETWDRADLMDAEYYVCPPPTLVKVSESPSLTSPIQPYSPPSPVAPPSSAASIPRQPPQYRSATLDQCTAALDRAQSEAEKFARFLSAFSCTSQDIVTVHVHDLTLSAARLIADTGSDTSLDSLRAV